jgi:hypothetical protein
LRKGERQGNGGYFLNAAPLFERGTIETAVDHILNYDQKKRKKLRYKYRKADKAKGTRRVLSAIGMHKRK